MVTATTVIHHGGCPDGFGSAWWLGKHLGHHDKFAANYDEPPPLDLCAGRQVYIVDFCYPTLDIAAIAEVAETVDIFDHHQTAAAYAEDYANHHANGEFGTVFENAHAYSDVWELCGGDKVNIVIDQSHSGIGIVSQVVERRWGTKPPAFLANLEDRDLWRFELPDTKDVFAAVTSRPYTDEAWDQIAATYHGDLVNEGRAINRYRDQLIEQVAASSFALRLAISDLVWVDIPCASSPYAIGSDVAGLLAKDSKCSIGAYVILHEDNVQVGLRSTGTFAPDVAALAERYGGGGHMKASGLRLTWDQFAEMAR